jgi:hypothetical protein
MDAVAMLLLAIFILLMEISVLAFVLIHALMEAWQNKKER